MVDNKIIHGIWFGSKLTNMQKLCIRSYQDYGHEFHIWTAEPVEGIPEGTVIRDMNEMFPAKKRAKFTGTNYLSDYFRVLLIRELGGWYVDMDTICLQYFNFDEDYAFVSEPEGLGPTRDPKEPPVAPLETSQKYLSGCIFKAPKGNDLCKEIVNRLDFTDTLHPDDWICFGPRMFQDVIPMMKLTRYVKAPVVFDAINYNEGEHLVSSGVTWNLSPKSYAIHIRTSGWKAAKRDPDASYPEDSLYEQLKKKHGVK